MEHQSETFQLPARLSTNAAEYDWLYYFIYWMSVALFVAIVAVMIYFVIRFHRSRNPQSSVTQKHTKLELFWTFSPLIILVVLFHLGFQGYVKGAVAPDNAISIRVHGKQWLWEFEYPNGFKEVGVLRVPVNKPVRLVMSSDPLPGKPAVLHSFYVPGFRWKKDVVPGMYSSMWFQATKVGDTQVFCAEYCGTSHSGMLATIKVIPSADYDKFLKEGVSAPEGMSNEDWGKQLYSQNNCNTCHSLDGSALVGPTWKGIWGRNEQIADGSSVKVDENYIRESILNPQAKVVKGYPGAMPPYVFQDKQIDAIIAFMKTLK